MSLRQPAVSGRRAAFVYSDALSEHVLSDTHPMKPERLRYTHELLQAYGAFEPDNALIVEPRPATDAEIGSYHTPGYIEAVRTYGRGEVPADAHLFNFGPGDNPAYPGVFDASALSTGASVVAAELLMKLPGWGHRMKVATSWTYDLFLPRELVQLKLQGTRGIQREHFEPGQEVFHQGDLGDRVYIVMRGKVEVVKHSDGRDEQRLATISQGETFGEMALLNETRRTATIRCLEPTDCLSLPKGEFTALAANLPDLRKSFDRVMEARAESTARATETAGPGGASADG